MSADEVEMPRYRSHKIVHALKIKSIVSCVRVGDFDFPGDHIPNPTGALIYPEEAGYGPVSVDLAYMEKHKPQIGGYYVVYPDGYKSWSPAQAFESGYTRVE